MTDTLLVIGNQNYSSWSFRAWLALKLTGVPFELKKIYLRKPDTSSQIASLSPSGKVPLFCHNGQVVWDSLAIGLVLTDQFPHLLPQEQHLPVKPPLNWTKNGRELERDLMN